MKKTIIIFLIVSLLSFMGGYFLGQSKLTSNQNLNIADNNSQVNSKSTENSVVINSLSGAVEKIDGNNIILAINESDTRIIETDDDTKIYVLEEKSPEQYQKEMEEFNKKIQEQTSNQLRPREISTAPLASVMSPEVFAKKIGAIADIKNGILLTVVADQDIKSIKQFKAKEIIIPPPRANVPKK